MACPSLQTIIEDITCNTDKVRVIKEVNKYILFLLLKTNEFFILVKKTKKKQPPPKHKNVLVLINQ